MPLRTGTPHSAAEGTEIAPSTRLFPEMSLIPLSGTPQGGGMKIGMVAGILCASEHVGCPTNPGFTKNR